MRDIFLIEYTLWMHTHTNAYFLSRSVNLIIVITVRHYATRLLRERFIWGHVTSYLRRRPSACVRVCVSNVMLVRRPLRGFRVHYAIISAAYRYNVHRMRITWTRRWHGQLADQLASGVPEREHPFSLSFAPTLPIYTSMFPFRKIVVIRRRFIPTAIREFPQAGCRLLTRECACDYFQRKYAR